MNLKRLFGKGKSKSSSSPGICPVSPLRPTLIVVYMADAPALLQNCKSSPVAFNPATGKYFDFCSKSCSQGGTRRGLPQNTGQNANSASSMCEVILEHDY